MAEDVTILFNHFGDIADQLKPVLGKMVADTAVRFQSVASANAPAETGFLKSSIYTVTSEGSTYGEADNPPGDSYLLPEVTAPPDELTAYIAVGANYGAFVNYGHHTRSGSFVPPQPFWEPAVDTVMPIFEAVLGTLESQLESE